MPEQTQQLDNEAFIAIQIRVGGQVQGVGFRPFVYRLAQEYNLTGWVQNLKGNVLIHVEGAQPHITAFSKALLLQAPSISRPELLDQLTKEITHTNNFTIRDSNTTSSTHIHTPVDFAPCEACLADISDTNNRRYQYPFTNCTQCGPRYTLIERLPYDRANTSMADFPLCQSCEKEYNNPLNRRFHAEPVACPVCGPVITYQHDREIITDNQAALNATVSSLKAGRIVAIKGVGGYHLFCDAQHEHALQQLRTRKPRPDKPLAVMFPAFGHDELESVRKHVSLTEKEAKLIRSAARPIVLLKKIADSTLPAAIAPGLNEIGCCLPYSPLHYLLLHAFEAPLVATSANISGEPVLTNNQEVTQRLNHVTTTYLHHNRPISRPADDSVVRMIAGHTCTLRVGRGYAPIEMTLPDSICKPTLAVGAHMKNSIALAWGNRLVMSPHIADLGSQRSMAIFEQVIHDFQHLYEVEVEQIICDAHPGYSSSRWARKQDKPVFPVLHHHAHASALFLEYSIEKPWLVFTWDGTGLGQTNQLWGGEAFYGTAGDWCRVASFKPFRLPGGDLASRQAWRSAAAMCWQSGKTFESPADQSLVKQAWEKNINCTHSSSVGRLFDAAAALTGVASEYSYEGQGPMQLEALCGDSKPANPLPISCDNDLFIADWTPLLATLGNADLSQQQRANDFHETLAATLVEQAEAIRKTHGDFVVGLTGGVFQNKYLTELITDKLQQQGFDYYLNKTIPLNDGGISAGQIMEVLAKQSLTHQ